MCLSLLWDIKHLSSKVSPTDSAQVTRQQTKGQWLPKMQTQHEKACGTKLCQGKLTHNMIHLPIAGSSYCMRKTVEKNIYKLGEDLRIPSSILFQVWCFSYYQTCVAYMLNGHTWTECHPLTCNGEMDLPLLNEIKTSFPSLCYFQMQPTGRGTRMEMGNRPFSRVRVWMETTWKHGYQAPLLKVKV